MVLDAGIATILRGHDTAENGEMPHVVYDIQIFQSYFAEKTVGISRFYAAKSNDSQADLLLEIQRCGMIRPSDVCRVQSFVDSGISGDYVVLQAQQILNDDNLPATDLTLQRIDPIEGGEHGTRTDQSGSGINGG